ncbi:uncharacterized protein LOC130662913 [Microplitis mediator]|uniref:uncharacterized protein LOC130662913 n=1 Tax=Microplitis mediator TaxID=375433 RepID=UPI00255781AB|nr:uncharacterized protein LOC130662913 [Microplitis mediator]
MKILPYSFMILEYFGGWKPLEWSTSRKGTLYNIYTLTIALTLVTFCISCIIDLFHTTNFEDTVQNMSMSLTFIIGCSKLILLNVKRNEILDVLQLFDTNICRVTCAEEANIQLKYDKKAKDLVKKYGGSVCIAVVIINSASVLNNIPTKTLPISGWFPYRHTNSSGFWVAYFHQMIALSVTSMIAFSFDTVVYGVFLRNCSQLQILKNRLENFVEILNEGKLNNTTNGSICTIRESERHLIKQCIHHHWIILQFSQQSNDLFAPIIFIQYSFSSLILCLILQSSTKLVFMSPEFIFMVIYLGCMLLQIFLFCWYGNEVTRESSGIHLAIYNMDWQVLTTRSQKDLLIMKTRAILPIRFTSGQLIELSLDSFTKLIKFSYSAYNLLHQKYFFPKKVNMKILPYSFMILEYFGGWKPITWSTSIKGKFYDIYALTINLTMVTFCMSCLIDLFDTTNFEDIVQNMSMSLTIIIGCLKLFLLSVKRNEIINVLQLFDTNICRVRCAEEANIQLKYDKKEKDLVKKYGGSVCMAVFLIQSASVLNNIPTRTLPINSWYPYRQTNSKGFWVAYFHQTIAITVTAIIAFAFDTVVYGVFLRSCSQLQILKSRLENFVEILNGGKLNNKTSQLVFTIRDSERHLIKQCIHHHWIILQFSQQSNDLFAPIIFIQYSFNSLVICLTVQSSTKLVFMSPEFIFMVIYLGCILLQIFLFCWYGNEVTLESSDIHLAICNMDWQVLTSRSQKDLLIMKTRAILPIRLTSGYLVELSLDSFTNLVKFSYSAYNLLHQRINFRRVNMKTLPYSFMILEYFGGWKPLKWSTSIKGKLYDIYTLIITLALVTFSMSCIIYLFYTTNFEDIVQNMSMSLTFIIGCSKLIFLNVKRNEIINVLQLLDVNICEVRCAEEANIQSKYTKIEEDLVKKYGGSVCVAVCVIHSASVLNNIPTRTLPINSWFPYHHTNSTGFWVAYFHQIIALSFTSMLGFSFDSAIYGVFLRNCCQLKILKNRLENFVEIINGEKLNNKTDGLVFTRRDSERRLIKQCIHHHWIILHFSEQSNDLFGPIIFIQYSFSSLILCLSVQTSTKLVFMSPEFISMILYLGCMLSEIFLFCWYSNEVTQESSGIPLAIYNMDWQVLTTRSQKDLLIMKTRAILPIRFTSGHLIELSLDSFTKLVKFSYSAYNLLHQK